MVRNTETTTGHEDFPTRLWWPLLCFARGLVIVVPLAVLVVMLNRLGMSNAMATLVTSLLLLPLASRPLATVVTAALGREKGWMVASLMVFALSLYFSSLYLSTALDDPMLWLCLVLMALAGGVFEASAAAWAQQQPQLRQPDFTMLRSSVTAMLTAVVIGMGVVLLLAGNMEVVSRKVEVSWTLALQVGAAIVMGTLLLIWVVARYVPAHNRRISVSQAWRQRRGELGAWWKGDSQRWLFVLFVVLFPMHEFFLWKGALLFLVDRGSIGGLMLSPQEIAFSLCTVAMIFAIVGFVMGMGRVKRDGLRRWWWWMALAVAVPDVFYIYLAYAMPESLWLITLTLTVEQWCSGFGMAGYIYYIMYGDGKECPATHLDICWTLGMLSIIFSGILTGAIQDSLGYRRFFIMVMVLAVVALATLGWMVTKRKGVGEENANP